MKPISGRFLLFLLSAVVIAAGVFLLGQRNFGTESELEYERMRVMRAIRLWSVLLKEAETGAAKTLEQGMKTLRDYFSDPERQAPGSLSPAELTLTARLCGADDIAILDSEGMAYKSSSPGDIGVNFYGETGRMEGAAPVQAGSGDTWVSRIYISGRTGRIRLTALHSPRGSEDIYQLSVGLGEYIRREKGTAYHEFLKGGFFEALSEGSPVLDEIDVFMLRQGRAWSLIHEGVPLDPHIVEKLAGKDVFRSEGKNFHLELRRFPVHHADGERAGEIWVKTRFIPPHRQFSGAVVFTAGVLSACVLLGGFCLFRRYRDETAREKGTDRLSRTLKRLAQGDYSPQIGPADRFCRDVPGELEELREALARRERQHRDATALLEDRMEERARELHSVHSFLQTGIETLPVPFYFKDIEGRYRIANTAFARLIGIPVASVVGMRIEDILSPAEAAFFLERDDELLRPGGTDSHVYTHTVRLPGYSPRELVFHKALVRDADGTPEGMVCAMVDITHHRATERALRESEARIRAVLETMHAGVAILDPATSEFVLVNPELCSMLGMSSDGLIGVCCDEGLGAEGLGRYPCEAAKDGEAVLISVTGASVPVLRRTASVTLEGKVHRLDCFMDISESKRAEALKEDVERIARHDLKAPLTAIIGLPRAVLEEGGLTEPQRTALMMIQNAAYEMMNLINLSLGLYKMETGTYTLEAHPVRVIPLLQRILAEHEGLITYRRISIRIEIDGEPDHAGLTDEGPAVYGEELLCYTLFSNLIKNALEACPEEGSVEITVKSGPKVAVIISNDGEVPEEIRNRFFEKYVTYGKSGGTGLGTYSARLIAEAQGGSVSLDVSRQGRTSVAVAMDEFGSVSER